MALLGATVPTLVDMAKRWGPDGKLSPIVEMLALNNAVVQDTPFIEGNLPMGHQYTARTGLPDIYFRLINQGVPPSKSQTAQATDQCAIMEARAQIDIDLAMLNGLSAAWRASENSAFLEAMGQKFATSFFYGNSGLDPEQFMGLAPRYSLLSAGNGGNIIDGGGTDAADNLSIWFVGWGGVTGIYPKGSTAGLIHQDLGEADAFDVSGNRFRALLDRYQWKCGISLPDWRRVVRIANIDVSALVAQSGQAVITKLMIDAYHRLPTTDNVVIYMNRTARHYIDIEQRAAVSTGGQLSYGVVNGQPMEMFRTMPVRLVDALLNTEARVV